MKIKTTSFRNIGVTYGDTGAGPCIVLLHGYLEAKEIWHPFVQRISERYRVLTPDLPGHGRSGVWGNTHSMDDMARAVRAMLEAEEVDRIFLAGHSMGGYVTMAFADLFPELLAGYALVHSTCFSDSEEKKKNRDREISLVMCGKKGQIINVNIPKGFANGNVERLKEEVDRAREIAKKAPDDGVVAVLNGMKARPDRTSVLKDPSIPLLLVGGMHDNYIPSEVFEKLVSLAPHATVLRLEKSGHMGFVEEPGEVSNTLLVVVDELFRSG